MEKTTLQHFSRQLAHWADTAISQGRFPFRKVEVSPSVLTAMGKVSPEIIFWINRDSYMAGGLLLLPSSENEDGTEMIQGRQCAHALGLQNFVTWGRRKVIIWKVEAEGFSIITSIQAPSPNESNPTRYQEILLRIMEELKVLSVLGASSPERFSPYYLANLCRSTFQDALPVMTEAYRIVRAEEKLSRDFDPGETAFYKGAMVLARLIAVVYFDQLPPTVQPEGLERAIEFAADNLPLSLRTSLQTQSEEIPLPPEGAVRFHHLFRRLIQLRCAGDRTRLAVLLEILISHFGASLHGFPLPAMESKDHALVVNGTAFERCKEGLIEVASPPLLAFSALWRVLKGLSPARAQSSDLSSFLPPCPPAVILGSLVNEHIPSPSERQILNARLRFSWPTRRFQFLPRTPLWAWEFIHLIGIADENAAIRLRLPRNWMSLEFGNILISLIQEQFTLEAIELFPESIMEVHLRKGSDPQATTVLQYAGVKRSIPWIQLRRGHPALIPLYLQTPPILFPLIERGDLNIPDPSTWPEAMEGEIFLFIHSSIGRTLSQIVHGGHPIPRKKSVREFCLLQGLPIPRTEVLANLGHLLQRDEADLPPLAALDRDLSLLLGIGFQAPEPGPAPRHSQPRPRTPSFESLRKEVAREVFMDGIPRFPEEYLYDYYRPTLVDYCFTGPLSPGEEFFEQITLRDQEGCTIIVEGQETARALLLASFSGHSKVALPGDRRVTADILQRYVNDLQSLRKSLLRKVHGKIVDSRSADAIADRIWQSFALPPWSLIEG